MRKFRSKTGIGFVAIYLCITLAAIVGFFTTGSDEFFGSALLILAMPWGYFFLTIMENKEVMRTDGLPMLVVAFVLSIFLNNVLLYSFGWLLNRLVRRLR